MHAYNPRKKNYQQLDDSLVGAARRDFLNDLIKELSLQTGENPKQHWLVIGPRGIGKSHILTLLYHKVKRTPNLSRLWLPVLFPEETRLESSLAKFLERAVHEIIQELQDKDPEAAEAIRDKIAKTRSLPVKERDDYVFSVLSWITQFTGKYILFITENLQHLLGKKFSPIEQKKLRAFLQTSDAVTLVGSATTVFHALHDHSHPFYHFFHIQRLIDLSFEDMKILISSILTATGSAEIGKRVIENEARIKALYVFTGGNPRMAVFLADILKTDVPEEMLDLMDGILDELTPYFETIFKDIPDYLEAVINTLAAFEPAQNPTEITAHLEGQSTTIRNYIKQLKDGGYVRIAFSRGRSNYYCLNEYLYRIWFQMRDSSHREETRWLLELLLMLYSPNRLLEEKEKITCDCQLANETTHTYSRLILQAADFMIKNPEYCRVIEWCVVSANSDEGPAGNMAKDKKIYTKISKLITDKKYDKAVFALKNYLQVNPDVAWAYRLWGKCLMMQSFFEEAIEKIKKAIEINPESASVYWDWGHCLRFLGRYNEAIEKFAKATDLDPKFYEAYGAWGDCLKETKKYPEADEKYQQAVTIAPSYADAYAAWGCSLKAQKQYEAALAKYQKAFECDPGRDKFPCECFMDCLRHLKRFDEAIALFKKYLSKHLPDQCNCSVIFYYGNLLLEVGQYEEASKEFAKLLAGEGPCSKAYLPYGRALAAAADWEGALEAYLKYLKFNFGNYGSELDFHTLYQKDIQSVLAKITPGPYIEKLYTPQKARVMSRTRNCMILVLLGKHEIVREHISAILTETNMKNNGEWEALDLLFFTIKFTLWQDLCLNKIHESLSLTELYSEYLKYLPTRKEKEVEMRSFALRLMKLQIRQNIPADFIKKIFLQLASIPEIFFPDVFLKISSCINEPESIQYQQIMSEKIIAEVVKELHVSEKEPKKSECDSCRIFC